MVGEPVPPESSVIVHLFDPIFVIAYRFIFAAKYTVPSKPTAGDDRPIRAGASYVHRTLG
jgi:hypothetical protein